MIPFVIGIAGDSGSGKNTIADAVEALVGPDRVTDLRLDDYHRFTREERAARGVTALNPLVHNFPLMQEHLRLLRRGRPIRNRTYEHSNGTFGPIRTVEPNEVILVRGLIGYPTEEMRELYDLAVFIQPDPELLFRWKLRRDVLRRGYTEAQVLSYIAQHLLDAKQYVLPQAERADVVVRYRLEDEEASDATLSASLLLRRQAARVARERALAEGLEGVERRSEEEQTELTLRGGTDFETVQRWALADFPDASSSELGRFLDEQGGSQQSAQLAFVEGVLARLTLLGLEARAGEAAPPSP